MATLVISAAVSIVAGVALRLLFPPDDIEIDGSRIDDFEVTGAAAGKVVKITEGTDMVGGHVIWATPGGIRETLVTTSEDNKGGSSTKTTEQFLDIDIRISVGAAGLEDVLQIYADEDLIFDKTGVGEVTSEEDVLVSFHPGGESQFPHPIEEAEEGVGNVSAYRHLSTVFIERFDVTKWGRIPNLKFLVTSNVVVSDPFTAFDEPVGFDGEISLSNFYLMLNTDLGHLYYMGEDIALINTSDMTLIHDLTDDLLSFGLAEPASGMDGKFYYQTGPSNSATLRKVDWETGFEEQSFGGNGTETVDTLTSYANAGNWAVLYATTAFGLKSILCHMAGDSLANETRTMSVVDGDTLEPISLLTVNNPFTSLDGFAIPDDTRNVFWTVTEKTSGSVLEVVKIKFNFNLGPKIAQDEGREPMIVSIDEIVSVKQFTNGSPGDDFETSSIINGWALHKDTGNLLLSNVGGMVLFDPDTGTVLAKRSGLNFESRNNFIEGPRFSFVEGSGSISGGVYHTIDMNDLTTIKQVNLDSIAFSGSPGAHGDTQQVYSSVYESIIFNRDWAGAAAAVDGRIVRLEVNRSGGGPETLDNISTRLLTNNNGLRMANLDPADFDVTALAPIVVEGFSQDSKMKIADLFEVYKKAAFFDLVEEDWIIKAVVHGGASAVTIPEEWVGEYTEDPEDETVQLVEMQPQEIPRRVWYNFISKDDFYERGQFPSQRIQNPVPSMFSNVEGDISTEQVFTDAEAILQAQRWLYKTWAERKSLNGALPWRYLRLSPTDVFMAGFRGQTLRVRLGTQDIGVNLKQVIEATLENTSSLVSTLPAAPSLGTIVPEIEGRMATLLFPFNAPLLRPEDLNNGSFSQAYTGIYGTSPGWDGGESWMSINNVDYTQKASSSIGMAIGKIVTPPTPWPNSRVQRISDGGVLVFTSLNLEDSWVTQTEADLYNLVNAIAIQTSTGVEIVSYQNLVNNGDGTCTIDTLLRGQGGTEKVAANGGITVNDRLGRLDIATRRNKLILSDLNVTRFFKGLGPSQFIEDGVVTTFVYTGRDLMPFSVSQLELILGTITSAATWKHGGSIVDWDRRTRVNGELLDGVDQVPLNEDFEKYDVTFRNIGTGVATINKEVVDATELELTEAEWSQVVFTGPNLLTNGDFETGVLTPWVVLTGSTWAVATLSIDHLTIPDPNFADGNPWILRYSGGAESTYGIEQLIDLSSVLVDFVNMDKGLLYTQMWTSFGQSGLGGGSSSRCPMRTGFRFEDGSGVTISTIVDDHWHNPNSNVWKRVGLWAQVPPGTRKIGFQLLGSRFYPSSNHWDENEVGVGTGSQANERAAFDNVIAKITDGNASHNIEVFQKSGSLIDGELATIPAAGV